MGTQRGIGWVSAALVAAAITAHPAGSAVAAGQEVTAPYVDGRSIHDGATVVPIRTGDGQPPEEAGLRGLGRTQDGRWAVQSTRRLPDPENICDVAALWLVDSNGDADLATERTTCLFDDAWWTLGFSDTGDRFVETYAEADGRTSVAVRDLAGNTVAARRVPDWLTVLDFTGDRLVLGTRMTGVDAALWIWTLGDGLRRAVRGTVHGADLQANAQWRPAAEGRFALRRLDASTVLWRLRFRPVVFSPDRARVLGLVTTASGSDTTVAQVRRVRDGALVRTIRPDVRWTDSRMGWDGNGSVFGPWSTESLMRCPLAAPCTVAQPVEGLPGFSVVAQN